MGNKIQENAVKNYHPEIINCPFCNTKMKYKYAISNKVVQFTSGKYFRVRNLGYSCPNCNDGRVYFSQTANKLCFKGNTYSAKILCLIDYYKTKHLGREGICDILATKGIEISDRNVDSLYKKFLVFLNQDKDSLIFNAYETMQNEYNQIRLSIDCISVESKRYIIMYNYFSGEKLAIWKIDKLEINSFENVIGKYINDSYNIKVIISIRNLKGGEFIPLLKKLAPKTCEFYSYEKY